MKSVLQIVLSLAGAALVPSLAAAADYEPSALRLSGFATLGAVASDVEAPWRFRRDVQQPADGGGGLQWRTDSRLGLQANLQLNRAFELVAQGVLQHQSTLAPLEQSLKWAFLAWRPAPGLTLRLGRISPDLFLLAEYRNVGIAYPWARPSTEFYGWLPNDSGQGADVAKSWRWGAADWQARVALVDAHAVSDGPNGQALTLHARQSAAATLSREQGPLTLKLSWTDTRYQTKAGGATVFELPFRQVGVGALWRASPWQWQAEIGRADSFAGGPSNVQGYSSLAYRRAPWTVFGMVGRQHDSNADGPATSAVGLLALQQTTLSAGLRWDVTAQTDLKLQWDHVWVGRNGSRLWAHGTGEAREPNVLSLALDTAF